MKDTPAADARREVSEAAAARPQNRAERRRRFAENSHEAAASAARPRSAARETPAALAVLRVMLGSTLQLQRPVSLLAASPAAPAAPPPSWASRSPSPTKCSGPTT